MTKRDFQQQEYINEVQQKGPYGASFYCIDGMKKGDTIVSDFKPTITSLQELYYKYTFAIETDLGILFTDIASVEPDLKRLIYTEDIPLRLRTELPITINSLSPTGELVK